MDYNPVHEFYDLPPKALENSDATETIHAVLGRALIYVTAFEQNCKGLLKLIHVLVTKPVHSEDALEQLLEVLNAKHKTLNSVLAKLVRLFSDDMTVSDLLHLAREHRNAIVHELASGLIRMADGEDEKAVIRQFLDSHLHIIARANLLVCTWAAQLSGGPLMNRKAMTEYEKVIVQWVLGPLS